VREIVLKHLYRPGMVREKGTSMRRLLGGGAPFQHCVRRGGEKRDLAVAEGDVISDAPKKIRPDLREEEGALTLMKQKKKKKKKKKKKEARKEVYPGLKQPRKTALSEGRMILRRSPLAVVRHCR